MYLRIQPNKSETFIETKSAKRSLIRKHLMQTNREGLWTKRLRKCNRKSGVAKTFSRNRSISLSKRSYFDHAFKMNVEHIIERSKGAQIKNAKKARKSKNAIKNVQVATRNKTKWKSYVFRRPHDAPGHSAELRASPSPQRCQNAER